jgi:hypothetical protein
MRYPVFTLVHDVLALRGEENGGCVDFEPHSHEYSFYRLRPARIRVLVHWGTALGASCVKITTGLNSLHPVDSVK